MKIFPYLIALLLSSAIAGFVILPFSLFFGWIHVKIFNDKPGFWNAIYVSGFENFIIVWFSILIFSLFGFSLPVFFIILITGALTYNNFYRYYTRNNKQRELGYILGQLGGIPIIYWISTKEILNQDFVFW